MIYVFTTSIKIIHLRARVQANFTNFKNIFTAPTTRMRLNTSVLYPYYTRSYSNYLITFYMSEQYSLNISFAVILRISYKETQHKRLIMYTDRHAQICLIVAADDIIRDSLVGIEKKNHIQIMFYQYSTH